jgi:hypothetical protein
MPQATSIYHLTVGFKAFNQLFCTAVAVLHDEHIRSHALDVAIRGDLVGDGDDENCFIKLVGRRVAGPATSSWCSRQFQLTSQSIELAWS